MSTYQACETIKRMMARELKKRGWMVHDYQEDHSGFESEYYSPEWWGGIAEKNGYVLVVDMKFPEEERIINQVVRHEEAGQQDFAVKIGKLKRMTVANGASAQEEESAKAAIKKLKEKQKQDGKRVDTVSVTIPAHMENPTGSNWHIERDGIVIERGNGLLKFAKVSGLFLYENEKEDMLAFKRMSEEEYKKAYVRFCLRKDYNESDLEEAKRWADCQFQDMKENEKLFDGFNQLMGKIDTTAGSMMGDAKFRYEKQVVTEYKNINIAYETKTGNVQEGQTFVVKTDRFNVDEGDVYKIHEYIGKDKRWFYALRMNEKLTKELKGRRNPANRWHGIGNKEFMRWLEKGMLAWCEIKTEKIPYQVEKIVKVTA